MAKTQNLEQIDKPHYNYWQALVYSFFSEKLYVDVGKRWKGFGFSYFLLMIFIVSIPYTIYMVVKFEAFFEKNIARPFAELPPIVIQDGAVKIDKPMPDLIKNSDNKVMIILDTSGQITSFDSKYPDAFLLITSNKILYRNPTISTMLQVDGYYEKVQEVNIDKNINQIFSGKDWIDSFNVRALLVFFDIIMYPIIAGVIYFLYLTLFIAFAFIAQLMAQVILKHQLSYKQSYRILIVASTPQLIILSLVICFNLLFQGFGFIIIALLASYFFFAVLALKRESKKLVLK